MTANQLACSRHVERLRAMATSAWPCVPVRSLSVPVLTCMFTLLVLSQANIAFAQSAQLPAPPAASTPAAPSSAPQPRAPELRIVPTQARPMPNDPTMPSPEIRSLLDGEKTNANAAPNAPPPNPTIRLRARVIAKANRASRSSTSAARRSRSPRRRDQRHGRRRECADRDHQVNRH